MAFLAELDNPDVQALTIDIYKQRILDPRSNAQEILAYLNAMVKAREPQLASNVEKEQAKN